MKLRPCDCDDQYAADLLNEQGIGFNNERIIVEPNSVILQMGHTTIKIPMRRFKMFAEWYLKEQTIKHDPIISRRQKGRILDTSKK